MGSTEKGAGDFGHKKRGHPEVGLELLGGKNMATRLTGNLTRKARTETIKTAGVRPDGVDG